MNDEASHDWQLDQRFLVQPTTGPFSGQPTPLRICVRSGAGPGRFDFRLLGALSVHRRFDWLQTRSSPIRTPLPLADDRSHSSEPRLAFLLIDTDYRVATELSGFNNRISIN